MTIPRRLLFPFLLVLGSLLQAQEDDPPSKKGAPPQPEGLKALQHPDAKVRYQAVTTLLQLGPLAKFAVPDLRALLKDKNALVRVKTAEALWKIDKTPSIVLMPVLLSALKDNDPSVRAAAPPVIALLGSKAKSALPALTRALEDKNFDVKLSAIAALGDLGPIAKTCADDLLDVTKDKDFFLLEPFVGAALANLGQSTVPSLSKALADTSDERRRVAAYALGSMGPTAAAAVPALADALKDHVPATRKQAACALGKIGKSASAVVPKLEALLTDKDAAVRIQAALAIWYISGTTNHVSTLVNALSDESPNVRDIACQALGKMKAAANDAVLPLAKLTNDKDLRIRAIMTLGEIGPTAKKALPKLEGLLGDNDGESRLSAAFALWQISGQTKHALPVLEKGLESEVHDRLAIRLLGDMGEAAKSTLPTLVALFRAEEVASYRQHLAVSIKKIDPKTATQLGIR